MTYSTTVLPQYVRDFLGGPYRDLEMLRLSRRLWVFTGAKRMLFVWSGCAVGARAAARDAVAHLEPKTDRRRSHWEYT